MTLAELAPGETGRVSSLAAQDPLRRRLIDLGLIQGTLITCMGESPLGDPRAYGIRGAIIALRRKDQAAVHLYSRQGGESAWG